MSTRRLAESVKGLNSSLALEAGDLWPNKGRPIAAVKGLKSRLIMNRIIQSLVITFNLCSFKPSNNEDGWSADSHTYIRVANAMVYSISRSYSLQNTLQFL